MLIIGERLDRPVDRHQSLLKIEHQAGTCPKLTDRRRHRRSVCDRESLY
jgi:hypothetical protein